MTAAVGNTIASPPKILPTSWIPTGSMNTGTVIVAIAITRIPFGGRVIRSVVLSLKEMPFV